VLILINISGSWEKLEVVKLYTSVSDETSSKAIPTLYEEITLTAGISNLQLAFKLGDLKLEAVFHYTNLQLVKLWSKTL